MNSERGFKTLVNRQALSTVALQGRGQETTHRRWIWAGAGRDQGRRASALLPLTSLSSDSVPIHWNSGDRLVE